MLKRIGVFFLIFFLLLDTFLYAGSLDFCSKGLFLDVFFDIRWEGIFPLRIAGVKIRGPVSNPDNPPEESGSGPVICFCKKQGKPIIGIMVSYWNPVKAIETTKIPWCFPTFGVHFDFGEYWKQLGTNSAGKDTGFTFTNSHLIKLNLLDVLNLFMDVPCVPHEGLDIAYFSELDPSWASPLIAYFLNPEAILFANPIAQLACVADSAASAANYPLNPLFWCAGAWGGIYPFSGDSESSHYLRGNVLNMARLIYRQARLGVSWDTGISECGAVITPIWIKSHYKFHEIKPVRSKIMTIGKPLLLWESMKNPPGGTSKGSADNFSWMLFKFVKCCMSFF